MRGQAHTVEAFVAAVLLITGLIFAVQATAVTPLSASTSNQHIENQQRSTAQGLLSTAADAGDLREAVLFWDPEEGEFHNASQWVNAGGPPVPFGDALKRTFDDRRIAYNVQVRYHNGTTFAAGGCEAGDDPTGEDCAPYLVNQGSPSDNAVSATRTIVLHDSDTLSSPDNGNVTLADIEDDSALDFYVSDRSDDDLYTVLEVRIVVWRK